jgi:hypothetical protein
MIIFLRSLKFFYGPRVKHVAVIRPEFFLFRRIETVFVIRGWWFAGLGP